MFYSHSYIFPQTIECISHLLFRCCMCVCHMLLKYYLLTYLLTSVPDFSSLESSSVTLQLSHSKLSVFNIYRPPSSSSNFKPFSVFLDDFSSFLSSAATTPHEFITTGDFNIHLDNPADTLTSQLLSLLSFFQSHSTCQQLPYTRQKSLFWSITSSDTLLAPAVSFTPLHLTLHPTTFLSSPNCL